MKLLFTRIRYFYSKIIRAYSSDNLIFKTKNFLSRLITTPFVVLKGYLRLSKTDRNLNLKDGFFDHRKKKVVLLASNTQPKRIVDAYNASKKAQSFASPPYQIKGLWKEWISINYKELITALENENLSDLSVLLGNLSREQFTIGTGGYDNYIRYHSLLGVPYIKYVWCKYRDLLLGMDYKLSKITNPIIGNPTGVLLDKKIISIDNLRHAYHAVEMCEILRDLKSSRIVEIGGGLGGQAYQTMQMADSSIHNYTLFDIPEVNVISSYFLLLAFPNKRIRLFGEGSICSELSNDFEIGIFPHFKITQLENCSVDLFYNSCSFSEMDGTASNEYLSVIERVCKKYFLHVNHDVTFKSKNPDGSFSENIIGSKLVPNKKHFKRLFKKGRQHGVPEDRLYKAYEYLYEKIN